MDRKKLIDTLKTMGIPELFLDKPGVVERIFADYATLPVQELQKADLNVKENSFSYNGGSFSLTDKGTIQYKNEDKTITLNEYGIETSLESGLPLTFHTSITRKHGLVHDFDGNDSNGWYDDNIGIDNGSWSLETALGHKTEHNMHTQKTIDVNQALDVFDENAADVIENYPKTKEWYAKKREEVKDALEKHNIKASEIEKFKHPTEPADMQAKIELLEKENQRLEKENKRLKDSNHKMTKMLKVSMGFAEKVKRSPVGKVFFGRELKKFVDTAYSLDSGDDNSR